MIGDAMKEIDDKTTSANTGVYYLHIRLRYRHTKLSLEHLFHAGAHKVDDLLRCIDNTIRIRSIDRVALEEAFVDGIKEVLSLQPTIDASSSLSERNWCPHGSHGILVSMKRRFKTVDYDQALDLTVRLGDCLPPEHLARFVVDSVAQLDLSALYAQYGPRGGEPYAPEVLLGLLLYGYAIGVFSSRKIERATYEAVPFRFIAGNLHPDHDTLAAFRRTFLPELKELFVQVLLLAQEAGVLKLGTISLDGTKVHADASKRKAVSYQRLQELETQLRAEVEELFALSEQLDQPEVPDGLVVREEIARREDRLTRLAEAKAVLEARAQERVAAEQAEYEAKLAQRAERERTTGRRPGGRPPSPPTPGPRDGDQYNFSATSTYL
jgi:transposase